MTLCHAVSPAVPAHATDRVKRFADERDLPLHLIDAEEMQDPDYTANPVNRCYFCKSNLYRRLAPLVSEGTICAGTNVDDLGDYRPGLTAADEHDVRHPFVEAGLAKADIRNLARSMGLGDVAELPAAPCLASRIETGLRVTPRDLKIIDRVEGALRDCLGPVTLRCRRRRTGLVIEIDPELFAAITKSELATLTSLARHHADANGGSGLSLSFEAYSRGSAFLHA
ncbi:hypothetical protein Salmuc_03285 [Salipiger mucosus DSM 16094]|uniref:ATP-utilizing enzyme of the PP-loop superfamily n=2 Tax=Salipiger mucosus TaxID=263378 RepID=S9QEG0_9RHOB|nr:hypothetical protein Salmuc_03285 [Salipiger mucosus DSM 16094]